MCLTWRMLLQKRFPSYCVALGIILIIRQTKELVGSNMIFLADVQYCIYADLLGRWVRKGPKISWRNIWMTLTYHKLFWPTTKTDFWPRKYLLEMRPWIHNRVKHFMISIHNFNTTSISQIKFLKSAFKFKMNHTSCIKIINMNAT